MLCRSLSNSANTMKLVCGGVPVITTAMDAHNMITTIMNTAS